MNTSLSGWGKLSGQLLLPAELTLSQLLDYSTQSERWESVPAKIIYIKVICIQSLPASPTYRDIHSVLLMQGIWCELMCAFWKSNIQDEHKRTLDFQTRTENKFGVLRTSQLRQSIENSHSFVHTSHARNVLRESHGRCRDKNPAHL
jgi:hypothetical protein